MNRSGFLITAGVSNPNPFCINLLMNCVIQCSIVPQDVPTKGVGGPLYSLPLEMCPNMRDLEVNF